MMEGTRWPLKMKWTFRYIYCCPSSVQLNIYRRKFVSCTVSWKRKHHPPSKNKSKKWNGQIDFRMASMFQCQEELNNHLMVSSRDITCIEHHSMMNECDAPLPVQLIKDLHGWQLLYIESDIKRGEIRRIELFFIFFFFFFPLIHSWNCPWNM